MGTAALMLRLFDLTRRTAGHSHGGNRVPTALWSALLVLVAGATWMWPAAWNDHAAESAFSLTSMWSALWPGLLALAGWLALKSVGERLRAPRVAPGDLLLGLADLTSRALVAESGAVVQAEKTPGAHAGAEDTGARDPLLLAERSYLRWTIAATTFVLLGAIMVWLAHS